MANAAPDPLPPPIRLFQLGIGHYVSRALDLAARLGVADLLADGPRGVAELASRCEADPAALRRVLRLLVATGVFSEDDSGRFGLLPMGDLLRSDVEGSMRSAVQLFAGREIQDSWAELEYCVRTGQPAFRKDDPDADAFDGMQANPEQAAVFDEAMATFTRRQAVVLAAACDFSRFGTIADVGGGNGALLLGILGAHPEPRGIVFDLPTATERAKREIARAGLAARCQAIAGDLAVLRCGRSLTSDPDNVFIILVRLRSIASISTTMAPLPPIAFNSDSAISPSPPAPKITIGELKANSTFFSAL